MHDNWIWFAFTQRRIYAPLEHLELPHHFARIATQAAALVPFVQDYGRLGWHEATQGATVKGDDWLLKANADHKRLVRLAVQRNEDAAIYAEPINWIQAHAATVRWCLAAGQALKTLTARARILRCAELSRDLPRPIGCRGTVRSALMRERLRTKQSPLDFVGGMLQDYLWINLRGVRQRVLYLGDGRLGSVWGGDSLIESIYTLIANAVTGGRLAQCQSTTCGAAFVQTDERQRFCPPREGQDKSTCNNRERVQRYRKHRNEKQKGRHGKATRAR